MITRDVEPRLVNPQLESTLRYAIAIGVTLLLLLPGARGFSATFGWLPLWLLAMPLTAWWALHGFHVSWPARARPRAYTPRRRTGAQARRRVRVPARSAFPRAA